MAGRWQSRLGIVLLVVGLAVSMTAMPVAATDRPAVSAQTPTASTQAPAAVLTTPLLVADGTAATPLSTTSEITITVTDSANGQDTATTPVTVTDSDSGVPTALADRGVSSTSYTAVVGTDSQLGAGNLAAAIQSWAGDDGSQTGFVGDTDVGAGELSSMINYWATEIAG